MGRPTTPSPGRPGPPGPLDALADAFYRVAASGVLPASWFAPRVPPVEERAARTGALHVETVSHCYRYAHLLAYQLGSLVHHPPQRTRVTATVFHSPEDEEVVRLLELAAGHAPRGVTWNWQPLAEPELFRRSIGRNRAAQATQADWIWFTDCDVMFGPGCLDALGEALQGRREALFHPRHELRTSMLPEDHELLTAGRGGERLLAIPDVPWHRREFPKATGPVQITHGDVARAVGYCEGLGLYQRPADRWRKTREDRAFRWVLGTQGIPLEIPAVHRVRHVAKGRYHGGPVSRGLRSRVRRLTSWWTERGGPATDAGNGRAE